MLPLALVVWNKRRSGLDRIMVGSTYKSWQIWIVWTWKVGKADERGLIDYAKSLAVFSKEKITFIGWLSSTSKGIILMRLTARQIPMRPFSNGSHIFRRVAIFVYL